MMRMHKRSSIFVELIIVILFFSLSVLLAVQLFTQAQVRSLRSERENHALLRAQSAMETLTGCETDSATLMAALDGCTADGRVFYDKSWNVVAASEDAAFELTVTTADASTDAGKLVTLNVRVAQADGEALVELQTDYYLPGSTALSGGRNG